MREFIRACDYHAYAQNLSRDNNSEEERRGGGDAADLQR